MLLIDILVGVALDSVPAPPSKERVKSFTSRLPLPLPVLNTASLNVTAMVLLSAAITTEEMRGAFSAAVAAMLKVRKYPLLFVPLNARP